MGAGGPTVLSRHSGAGWWHCDHRAWNLNAWCVVAGNPFQGPVRLMPNSPDFEVATVEYGPMVFPDGTDTLTVFLASTDGHEHEQVLSARLALLDPDGRTLSAADASLTYGENARRTLSLGEAAGSGVFLRMAVAFEAFAGGRHFGNVSISYLLAHQGSDLVDLFNAAGSDKGTEVGVGSGAVPHCYAVEYHRLFDHLRDRRFRLLEIGLQSHVGEDYAPTDAPSLRVWREFFPHAEIYGFDLNDFSFFEQDRTTVVRGDQGSPEDLRAFVAEHGAGRFELVLDDGSHASSDQQVSLATLFDSVAPGGLYVIEDLHWQPRPETPTTLEVLRKFSETRRIESPFIGEEVARRLEAAIDRVEIHKPNDSEFAVIYRRVD